MEAVAGALSPLAIPPFLAVESPVWPVFFFVLASISLRVVAARLLEKRKAHAF